MFTPYDMFSFSFTLTGTAVIKNKSKVLGSRVNLGDSWNGCLFNNNWEYVNAGIMWHRHVLSKAEILAEADGHDRSQWNAIDIGPVDQSPVEKNLYDDMLPEGMEPWERIVFRYIPKAIMWNTAEENFWKIAGGASV